MYVLVVITWTLYYVAKYSEVQERVRTEVLEATAGGVALLTLETICSFLWVSHTDARDTIQAVPRLTQLFAADICGRWWMRLCAARSSARMAHASIASTRSRCSDIESPRMWAFDCYYRMYSYINVQVHSVVQKHI